jgi:hypothetical protein
MTKTGKYRKVLLGLIVLAGITSCQSNKHENIKPVPFTSVKVTDNFWAPRIKINSEVTIPIAIQKSTISGRIRNFEIAGGTAKGQFQSEYPFDDSDIYKIIEAASYSMQTYPDPKLDAIIDTLIEKVGKAQEPDGYLYTCRTINPENPHPWCDNHRWLLDSVGFGGTHELYNCGHLYEAAAAHFRATGKRTLLDIATKNADLLVKDFGYGKLEIYPGHQIVEMGLVKLYDVTGKKEYLDLAKFFLDVRGPKGEEYCQANKKVVEQTEPVGHAVRATYMYSGMADIAEKYNDASYLNALNKIWQTLVSQKTYITGGIGSGGGNEGFDSAYVLPNMSAYCETCSSVGDIFWNQRMFMAEGDAKFYDVLERTLFNAFLSGVSLKGDRFYYPNVLESMGQHQRGRWFGCACCPPNVARLLPSLPGYIYATADKTIYVNLFMANTANIDLDGMPVSITQSTNYPWDGEIKMEVNPKESSRFAFRIRIPGWAQNSPMPGDLYHFQDQSQTKTKISVNGKSVDVIVDAQGYVTLKRKWKQGDIIEVSFPMEVKVVQTNEHVVADRNKIAVERGPIVYCAEWPDNNNGNVLSLMFDKTPRFNAQFNDTLLSGVEVITTTAREVGRNVDNSFKFSEPVKVTLIPYYSWSNRGPGEMMVWLPTDTSSVYPQPAPTIISRSKLTASRMAPSLKVALTDQYQPENSNDHTRPFFHWWPINNTWEWIQSEFEKPETVSSCKVYWFDDGPFGGCRIPDTWKVQYLDKGKWKDVKTTNQYTVTKDGWDEIKFEPVTTTSLKLNIKQSEKFSTGIHEWQIH